MNEQAPGQTINEWYGPAMHIVEEAQAREYFETIVTARMKRFNQSREEAEKVERINLGYFAGYYSNETRARVERLFQCQHPFFGAIAERGAVGAAEAFEMGIALGKSHREKT